MKTSRMAAAVAVAAALCGSGAQAAADRPLKVEVVDVDGGAAVLFVTPEGRALLVDAGWPADLPPNTAGGSSADRIVAAARKLGVKRFDAAIITHYHLDHVGGVPAIAARIPIAQFMDHGATRELAAPGAAHPTPEQQARSSTAIYQRYLAVSRGRRRIVRPGDTLALGALKLVFVAGDGEVVDKPLPGAGQAVRACDSTEDKPGRTDDENARSLGFVASYGAARILDLGDLTWAQERRLVCPTSRLPKVDLLIVSHHGAQLSNSPPLIEAAAPRVAIMSNGATKGGDKSVLETLKAAPSHPSVWQTHWAVRSSEANVAKDYVANLADGPDAAHPIEAEVWKDGRLRVTNGRMGFSRDYSRER